MFKTKAKNLNKRRAVRTALKDVYRLLIEEERWIKNKWALGPNGKEFNGPLPDQPEFWEPGSEKFDGAACFCLDGALGAVCADLSTYKKTRDTLNETIKKNYGRTRNIVGFNDAYSTHRDRVGEVLKQAIKEAG